MEIRELIGAVRRFWLLALVVLASALAVGYAAAFLPSPRYRSTATLIVTPASKRIDFTTVDTVNFLLPSLAAQAQTQAFADEVRARVSATGNWKNVTITAHPEAGTSILRISAETFDPKTAAVIANAAAQNLIARRVSSLVQLQVLDPGRPASAPASPNRSLILFAAGVIGLIGAVLAAVGANAILPSVRSASEIRRRFGLEVIGEIPNTRGFPKLVSRTFDPVDRNTELVEAYQRLRANFEIVARGRRVVGITSCTAGEGKSAVTANLAWAIGSMGENVLAVDTDLRRPTLHEYFGIPPGKGVADIPLGDDVKQLAQPTDVPTVKVMPSGYALQHPTAILHTAYSLILDSFVDSFILVDMPPILGTADAILVASMTKAVILVSDARHGDPDELEQVLHDLDRAGAQVLGVVLNRAVLKRSKRAASYYAEPSHWQEVSTRRQRLKGFILNSGAARAASRPKSVSVLIPGQSPDGTASARSRARARARTKPESSLEPGDESLEQGARPQSRRRA